ncbi:CsbD family protein [uncultured Jannaschia sp.]|uniref:CsbD family protein n=1 Tax=uncultured Jannaschia sp. TaxID=293347 RepID=UPI002626ACB0|nr:CsbD family protein [uncultured Jannaschia sp.]
MANEDQTEGKTKDITGKIKEEAGDLTGNDKMKHEGQADQVEGKVQKGVGDLKEDIKKM